MCIRDRLGHVEYDTGAKEPARKELTPMAQVFGALIKAEIRTVMSPAGKVLKTTVPPKLLETLKNAPVSAQLVSVKIHCSRCSISPASSCLRYRLG